MSEEKKKIKIGQRFKFVEERVVVSALAETNKKVEIGDECFVGMSNGVLTFNFLTGNLAGKSLIMNAAEQEEFEIEGYDTHSIASMLLERLGWRCGLDDAIEEFEIDKKTCISEMEDLLDEILFWQKAVKEE